MIVRDEAAILGRSLRSVADHIDYWVICDTGSTDETKELVRSFFAERGIPGELHSFAFDNFANARNRALDLARGSKGDFDYLLLMDADMELAVEDAGFRRHLAAPAYRVLQKSVISYWNTRLLRRGEPARYRGVTHEYLDRLPDLAPIHSIWFVDHADGANRPGKLERDIRLLQEGLEHEPANGRYVFYLAQSFRDAGRWAEAAETYARRASMSGWDEETWYAQLQEARCRLALGDDAGFLAAATKAYELRPHRAEPLYDLARFHRLRGMYETAMMYCEAGSKLAWPGQDMLFIEDFVYATGIREEVSVAGYYCRSADRKEAGRSACHALALGRDTPEPSRNLARHNLVYYARPAPALFPSMRSWPLSFAAPAGNVMNSSVTVWNGATFVLVRNVNYRLTEEGRYVVPGDGTIETRNYLLRLDPQLNPEAWSQILPPRDMPAPRYSPVRGFEDARLFAWHGSLWCSSTVRELSPDGWCEMVLGRIDNPLTDACALTQWRVLQPEGPRLHQKNWMPRVEGDALKFIYSVDPTRVVDDRGRTLAEAAPDVALEHLRGGSQAIDFDGGALALTHETSLLHGRRIYLHRFVWFDQTMTARSVTAPFYFNGLGIEFAAGLAWHPAAQRLIVSFGIADAEAWMGTVSVDDVRAALAEGPHPQADVAVRSRPGSGADPIPGALPARRSAADPSGGAIPSSRRDLPKAYCIVCPQLPERQAAAEAHFRERGLEVESFAGVHGPTWGLATRKRRADGQAMSSGSVGLMLSHWTLWRVAERLDDEEVMIFEDDVILPEDFKQQFWRSYEQLPDDWQFVFVGFVGRFPQEPVTERVSLVRYPYGTHAYLVKRTALRTLIETNQEARTHLDLQLIDNTLPRLKCYTFTPSLAGQRTYAGEWRTSAGDDPPCQA